MRKHQTLAQFLSKILPFRHLHLIIELAGRDIANRYRRNHLGLAWAVLVPLASLAIYTVVFRHVLLARWPGVEASDSHFALNLFAGLLVFTWVSEVLGKAPRLISEQPNLVTKVVFPLEVFAWSSLLASILPLLLAAAIWGLSSLLLGVSISPAWLSAPLILASLVPLLLGLSWLLSALGTYLPDLSEGVGLFLSLLLFLSPIFYPLAVLPEWLRPWLTLNPISIPIESLRAAVFFGQWPDWSSLATLFGLGLGVSIIGRWFFERVRDGFADVL